MNEALPWNVLTNCIALLNISSEGNEKPLLFGIKTNTGGFEDYKQAAKLLFKRYICTYVGYSESKYRLRISVAHPRDCPFAHVQ